MRLYSDSEKKWAIIKYKRYILSLRPYVAWTPCVSSPCRMEKCKEALTQSQGMILFGSKMKLSMMDGDGECRAVNNKQTLVIHCAILSFDQSNFFGHFVIITSFCTCSVMW